MTVLSVAWCIFYQLLLLWISMMNHYIRTCQYNLTWNLAIANISSSFIFHKNSSSIVSCHTVYSRHVYLDFLSVSIWIMCLVYLFIYFPNTLSTSKINIILYCHNYWAETAKNYMYNNLYIIFHVITWWNVDHHQVLITILK